MKISDTYQPEVSIVIPTYNRASLLERAIRSVLAQTVDNFEIIVVDDCSPDDGSTKNVIDKFVDARITYIRHSSNRGGSAARNTGIRKAKGSYLAFLDDDDEWLPDKLEKQINVFRNSNDRRLGLVYSGFIYVSDGNDRLEIKARFRGDVTEAVLKACIMGSATPLIKKDILLKAGLFDESLPGCQDWDMWIRLSCHCTFDYVSEALAWAFVHGNQMSTNLQSKIIAKKGILQKNAKRLTQYPSIYAIHLERLGLLLMLDGQRQESIRIFLQEIRTDKKRWKAYAHLVLALMLPDVHKALIRKYGIFQFGGKSLYY